MLKDKILFSCQVRTRDHWIHRRQRYRLGYVPFKSEERGGIFFFFHYLIATREEENRVFFSRVTIIYI